MKNLIWIFLLPLIFFSSCKKNKCADDCTRDLRHVLVDIEYVTSYPYIDEVKTFKKKANKLVYHLENVPISQSKFSVLSDTKMDETSLKGETFIFKAYNNGSEVLSEEYVIKNDCCHVIKVSGKERISL